MLNAPLLALSLLLTPVQYTSGTVAGDACQPTTLSPEVDVTEQRNDPVFSYNESTASLSQKSRATGTYRPAGATGPSWHTGGLTQGMFTYKRDIPYQMISVSNGLTCLKIQSINFDIVLTPQVWVANDYPPGTCMYNAVHEHEMKHVTVDRVVTDRHLPVIRAAVTNFSQGRGFFGPGSKDQVMAEFNQFVAQLGDVLQQEIDAMSAEDTRAQQGVDTLQEYQRINNLCADQLREMRQ